MQTALYINPTTLLPSPLSSPKLTLLLPNTINKASSSSSRFSSLRLNASASSSDSLTIDYNTLLSVFPAEACETIGGYACSADIYPETKVKTNPVSPPVVSEPVDREYLDYNSPETVLLEEACDDLGGEFCKPE